MIKLYSFIIALVCLNTLQATSHKDSLFAEDDIVLHTGTGDIYGSLCIPNKGDSLTLAIIIAGSGPTDRNGNNPYMTNNTLKKLAYGLSERGIATLRYDKRGIAASALSGLSENDLRFENYVDDVKSWIEKMKTDKRFVKIVIIGHSEGSMIGMLASEKADAYVSLSGPGRSADSIIRIQLASQSKTILQTASPLLDSLKAGKTIENPPAMLMSLFRPSIQNYLISWFSYHPSIEIAKLKIPVLIIQGDKDLQVSVEDSELLKNHCPGASYKLIKNMNHIFYMINGTDMDNMNSYILDLPLIDGLVDEIYNFIKAK